MKVKIIAHRGASGLAPENTLSSIRKALEIGVDYIEIDVRLSKDGVVMVSHDSSLKRVGRINKSVQSLTLKELKEIDVGSWFGKAFAGESMPTLTEVLTVISSHPKPCGLMIELKQTDLPPKVLVDAVFDCLGEFKLPLPKLVIGGFSLDTVIFVKRCIERLSPMQQLQMRPIGIVEKASLIAPFLDKGIALMAAWHKILIDQVIHPLIDGNVEVWSFTVNDKEIANRLIKSGVQGLITNFPGAI
jgi:glycerophosphoryl diester phosphodiesterase